MASKERSPEFNQTVDYEKEWLAKQIEGGGTDLTPLQIWEHQREIIITKISKFGFSSLTKQQKDAFSVGMAVEKQRELQSKPPKKK